MTGSFICFEYLFDDIFSRSHGVMKIHNFFISVLAALFIDIRAVGAWHAHQNVSDQFFFLSNCGLG